MSTIPEPPRKTILSTSTLPSTSPTSTSSSFPAKQWYHHLTLDLLVSVLSRSIFHPAITLIFYLCLAAVHQHRTNFATYVLLWAVVLAVCEVGVWVNRRVTYGASRKVEWRDEVVVVTGGGTGLGRVLVELVCVGKGARVAVLDLKGPDEEARELIEGRGGVLWDVCDVADLKEVRRAAERIEEELGKPTILINNAATPVNGLPLIPCNSMTITPEQATRTLQINTISHFNTLTTFLPSLISAPNGGHVVTISSILAHLSPSNLSDYAASKAALSSLHTTLSNEIAGHPSAAVRKGLKTILVEPGMMDTQLFADITSVPWYANFFGPVLDVKDMAREIIRVIDRGDGGVIRMPVYCTFMPLYGSMPGMFQKFMRWFAGIDGAIIPDKKRR